MSSLPSLELAGCIATITLRDVAVANRLGPPEVAALREHIVTVNACEETLVLRLRAQGKYFCSGYDINQLSHLDRLTEFAAMVDALEDSRPITIAALNGGAYGGGADLAIACDFRIGTTRAEMSVPAARLGLHFYGGGLRRFVSRLGPDCAKHVLLVAEKFNAEALYACGFLTHLVAEDEIDAALERLTATLAGTAPLALLGMKKHMNRIARGDVDPQELDRDVAQALASSDLREGTSAWIAKRTARFIGR